MIKKTMPFQKRHVLTLVFSAYFVLYVLSPMCFTQDGVTDEVPVAYQANSGTKNIRIIWELVLSNIFSQRHNEKENSQPHVQLLIKKARALTSTGSTPKFTKSGFAGISPDDIFMQSRYVSLFVCDSDTSFQGITCLKSSGLSPPAV